MLDRLSGTDEAGVAHFRRLGFLHQLLGLLDEPLDGVALLALGLAADDLEDLLEPLDLPLRLLEVLFKRAAKLLRLRFLGHLGKRLDDRVLGEVHVLQCLLEHFVQALHLSLQWQG